MSKDIGFRKITMKLFLDCIPCVIRQGLDSVRRVTKDETVHEQVLRQLLHVVSEVDFRQSPPVMSSQIHRLIREITGECDPYREMKDQSNSLALQLYPNLKSRVERSAYPLETAVRLAIAGNSIDVAVKSHFGKTDVHEAVENALTAPFDGDMGRLSDAVARADSILYLADNAGEIVFDRLLLEQLPLDKVTVGVRGAPALNDATMEDARTAGITDLVEVIDNGSDVPGTILEECSESFRGRFNESDIIIAKGQGNYETLSEVEKDIFFMLKVKCPLIARDIGCEVGSLVLRRSNQVATEAREGGQFARI